MTNLRSYMIKKEQEMKKTIAWAKKNNITVYIKFKDESTQSHDGVDLLDYRIYVPVKPILGYGIRYTDTGQPFDNFLYQNVEDALTQVRSLFEYIPPIRMPKQYTPNDKTLKDGIWPLPPHWKNPEKYNSTY